MDGFTPTCRICGLASPLETASTDDIGRTVHPECYATLVFRQHLEIVYRDQLNNFRRTAVHFLNAEIGMATTFTVLAGNSEPRSEERRRRFAVADKAYRTGLRFRSRVRLSSEERRAITRLSTPL